jgi:hypothetical protein
MSKFFTVVLRAGIAGAILLGLFGQVLVIPNSGMEELNRILTPFAHLYATVGILGIACVQVAMVAVWMLLAMIERDAIFTLKAFRWIDIVIGASIAATLLAAGVAVHLLFTDIPEMTVLGMWLASVAAAGVGACFAMLMVIMRGLLRKATDLEAEMAEVV